MIKAICTMEVALKPPNGRPVSGDSRNPVSAEDKTSEPPWAKKLRKMYDSVVEEPLPQSFDDLLKKLDQGDHD